MFQSKDTELGVWDVKKSSGGDGGTVERTILLVFYKMQFKESSFLLLVCSSSWDFLLDDLSYGDASCWEDTVGIVYWSW